jgi:hypothetical protein
MGESTRVPFVSLALGLLAAIALISAASPLRAEVATSVAPAYRIVDIGVLPGLAMDDSYAVAVNDNGQVIGESGGDYPSGSQQAFFWDASLAMQKLSTALWCSAFGMNNYGVVVGNYPNSTTKAFRWDASAGFQNLGPGPVAGYPYYGGAAINDSGNIAYANWSYSGPPGKAYLVSDGAASWIGELYSGARTDPTGLNNENEMVGYSYKTGVPFQAFFWSSASGIVGLGFLSGFTSSVAYGVNDASQAVGYCANDASGAQTAFVWNPTGGMSELGSSLIGATNTLARRISSGGIAVGWGLIGGTNHALAWAAGQDAVDLNSRVPDMSGWAVLRSANGINSSGLIVGEGLLTNGVRHAFVLYPSSPTGTDTPTPTPSPAERSACPGDCDGSGDVTVNEIIALVNIALGNGGSCINGVPAGATVNIALIIQAVNNALGGLGVRCASVSPVVTLPANPVSLQSNQDTTLSWSVSNATSCTASGDWSGAKNSAGGSQVINVGASAGSRTYNLSCTGPGGTVSRSVVVTVTAVQPGVCKYIGTCTGTFSGDDDGTWSVSIDNNCRLSGSGDSADGDHFTGTGNVTSGGAFTLVAGSVSTGAVFSGQIANSGRISGTWWNAYWQEGGTFEGHCVF